MKDPVCWNELQMWSQKTETQAEPVTQLHCNTLGQALDLSDMVRVLALQGAGRIRREDSLESPAHLTITETHELN